MTLSDFERELAAEQVARAEKKRDRSRDREERPSKHEKHKHRHRSHRHSSRDRDDDRESRHRHKRRRHDDDEDREHRRDERRRHDDHKDRERHRDERRQHDDDEDRKHRRDERRLRREHEESKRSRRTPSDDEDDYIEPGTSGPQDDEGLDERLADAAERNLKRDDWMQAPSSLDVDYVRRVKKSPEPEHKQSTGDKHELNLHKNELNHQLREAGKEDPSEAIVDLPAEHEVSYEFGDDGSQWRMVKLKNTYRQARETGRPVEEIALERYHDLREFDDAREEEIELERRERYGQEYVGKIKPSGELFQERKMGMGIRRHSSRRDSGPEKPREFEQGQVMQEQPVTARTTILDKSALNKLKAEMMKAKLRGASDAAKLEAEYNNAIAGAANRTEPEVVVLNTMENRMLAGGRKGEVNALQNKRGVERGLVEENEDMSIEDMVRQERRTKGQAGGAGRDMAERIAKDGKFDNDLDYLDENAEKLSKRIAKSDINLKNMAISDFQKMNRVLENCPLCYHEDKDDERDKPPFAPIVSLATRTYLTLPTEPELSKGGACIVPIQHRINLLECDDDEWEEIRNFMKCLIRMYLHQGRDVIFYENAAAPHLKRHAALMVVPLPQGEADMAAGVFMQEMLSADEEWTQHKKLYDTLKSAKGGLGKMAFRKTLAKEMPYFHVWFEIDGGLGHIVEDERRWPKGDLFARQVIGGMLDVPPDVIKKQGRWNRKDWRADSFKKEWTKFDWTSMITE